MNNQLTLPELRGYFTLKSLLHSGLKQVMSLFILGDVRKIKEEIMNFIPAESHDQLNQHDLVVHVSSAKGYRAS
jgi:hypothetical protein